jgi:type II secretory pathway pseudopilin PulG
MKRQRGFSLLQLMITVAVMGLLLNVFDKLLVAGLRGWAKSKRGYEVTYECREARERISMALRMARMNTVRIGRFNAAQPPFSRIAYVDTQGNSKAIFQEGNNIMAGYWSGAVPENLTRNPTDWLVHGTVERFGIFYPNRKDLSQLAFSFAVKTRAWVTDEKDIELVTTGNVEMKAP